MLHVDVFSVKKRGGVVDDNPPPKNGGLSKMCVLVRVCVFQFHTTPLGLFPSLYPSIPATRGVQSRGYQVSVYEPLICVLLKLLPTSARGGRARDRNLNLLPCVELLGETRTC